jgi:hypothetical protein
MSELQTRYPNLRQFLFYSAVNQGFLVSANASSNNVLRSLQGQPFIDHYIVPCSPSGNLPANHYGASGTVRSHEAYKLWEYYSSLERDNVDSWVLDSNGMRLWTKLLGWIDPPDGPWTYDQFLAQNDPPLQRIILDPAVATARIIVWAPKFLKAFINGYLLTTTGIDTDYLPLRASDDGNSPHSHNLGETLILQDSVPDIITTFPPNSQVKAMLVTTSGLMFWNNVDGEITPVDLMTILILLALVGQQLVD